MVDVTGRSHARQARFPHPAPRPPADPMQRPLSHIRVLDLSRILAGPWATQTLADLGAEIIKIERPGTGDDTRGWGPPFLRRPDGTETAESAYFLAANRGKRSLAVDLAKPEGAALARALAAKCDVVVENYKLGGLKKYGLDAETLTAAHPGLVYCSITGFGQTGPYAHRAGYDFMIQGMGGLMSVTGEADGRPGGGPQKAGVALADVMTGLYAAIAILGALAHRDRTGRGQHIDMALLDVQVATLANQALNHLVSGRPPGRMGNAHPNIVPYQAFATADGHIILAVGNDAQFARFCAEAGRPDLADDPRFATNRARVAHRDALIAILDPILAARASADWLAALERLGVPCGPINTIDRVFADRHVKARGLELALDHASGAVAPGVASPLRLADTPPAQDVAPPALGQHTRAVLGELLGLDDAEIDRLVGAGVVQE